MRLHLAYSLALLALPLSGVADAPLPRPQDEVREAARRTPEYIGAMACRKCHGDEYKSWKKTKMANAFDLLKPGVRAESKVEAGLDPRKDYTRDETCLRCHTTGWGKPGGYAIPPEGDGPEAIRAQRFARSREGVQCEACHGPGSLAAAYKKQHEDYQWSEAEAAVPNMSGMLFPDEGICKGCHNQDSPFVGKGYSFDFEERKEQGTHVHIKLDDDHGCPHEHHVTKRHGKRG